MLNVYSAMNMAQRVGAAYYPGLMMPYAMSAYGYGVGSVPAYGASMFAYGAVANVCHRVGYYENMMNRRMMGFWGNDPAQYYIDMLGKHAAQIAVPGGQAPTAQAPAQTPEAAQAAQNARQGQVSGTGSVGEAGETESDRRAVAKREAEESRKKEKQERLDEAVKSARSQALTHIKSLGYGETEAKHVVDAIEQKVRDDAGDNTQAIAANFNTILKEVPAKERVMQDRTGRQVKQANPNWAHEFGTFWARFIKGSDVNEAKAIAESAVADRVPSGRTPLDYARLEGRGVKKIGDKDYESFDVVAGSAVGSRAKKYEGTTLYRSGTTWYEEVKGRMRAIGGTRSWTYDPASRELSFNGRNWNNVPKQGMDTAIKISEAVDAAIGARGNGGQRSGNGAQAPTPPATNGSAAPAGTRPAALPAGGTRRRGNPALRREGGPPPPSADGAGRTGAEKTMTPAPSKFLKYFDDPKEEPSWEPPT